jgi:putative transposase
VHSRPAIPRDRNATFEPRFVGKHQRRLGSFEDEVIQLYAPGMSVREIQSYLEKRYGTEVPPTLITSITAAVLDEVRAWQARPLSMLYPIVYLDALVTSSRQDGVVGLRTVYVALGIGLNGEKELLGLWLAASEGAKFWLGIINE